MNKNNTLVGKTFENARTKSTPWVALIEETIHDHSNIDFNLVTFAINNDTVYLEYKKTVRLITRRK